MNSPNPKLNSPKSKRYKHSNSSMSCSSTSSKIRHSSSKPRNSEGRNRRNLLSKSSSRSYRHMKSISSVESSTEERWVVHIDISSIVSAHKNIQKIVISPYDTIGDLKKILYRRLGYDVDSQRLLAGHIELRNSMRILELDNGGSAFEADELEEVKLPVIKFSIKKIGGSDLEYSLIQFKGKPPASKRLNEAMNKCQIGFARRYKPDLAEASSGGTYFLKDGNKKSIACFKPADEEPMAPNNPREFLKGDMGGLGLRQGVLSGEGCYREVAAFVIDEPRRFHGVPPCTLIKARGNGFNVNITSNATSLKNDWKIGSFQVFVEHVDTMTNYSPSIIPPDELHKIGLLDMRILNTDRNEGNMLVTPIKSSRSNKIDPRRRCNNIDCRNSISSKTCYQDIHVTPIDHAFSIPSTLNFMDYEWCWLFWKQAKIPFSEHTKKYVQTIDIEDDCRRIKKYLGDSISDDCLRMIQISGLLMKKGVAAGLNLYQIGCMYPRFDEISPSVLEIMIQKANAHVDSALCIALNTVSRSEIPPALSHGSSFSSHNSFDTLAAQEQTKNNTDDEENENEEERTYRDQDKPTMASNLHNNNSDNLDNESLKEEEEDLVDDLEEMFFMSPLLQESTLSSNFDDLPDEPLDLAERMTSIGSTTSTSGGRFKEVDNMAMSLPTDVSWDTFGLVAPRHRNGFESKDRPTSPRLQPRHPYTTSNVADDITNDQQYNIADSPFFRASPLLVAMNDEKNTSLYNNAYDTSRLSPELDIDFSESFDEFKYFKGKENGYMTAPRGSMSPHVFTATPPTSLTFETVNIDTIQQVSSTISPKGSMFKLSPSSSSSISSKDKSLANNQINIISKPASSSLIALSSNEDIEDVTNTFEGGATANYSDDDEETVNITSNGENLLSSNLNILSSESNILDTMDDSSNSYSSQSSRAISPESTDLIFFEYLERLIDVEIKRVLRESETTNVARSF